MRELLSGPCEKCSSSLLADDLAAFLSLILTIIGLKVGVKGVLVKYVVMGSTFYSMESRALMLTTPVFRLVVTNKRRESAHAHILKWESHACADSRRFL